MRREVAIDVIYGLVVDNVGQDVTFWLFEPVRNSYCDIRPAHFVPTTNDRQLSHGVAIGLRGLLGRLV